MKANISLQPRYLSLSVATLLAVVVAPQAVWANDATATQKKVHELPTIEIVAEQGTKNEFNVVTMQKKEESTATDLRGLLRDEPAIEIGGGNGTSQYFAIRGMGQNSIDIKVDNAYSDSQILYHQGRFILDPSLVKIVEVQKGAGSASAGIGATNGAIIARTLDAQDLLRNSDKNYGFKLNAGYYSNDGYNYGASAFAKFANFDFLLSGNRLEEDDYKAGKGYLNSKGTDVVTNSALDKTAVLAKLGFNAGNHRFVLSHMAEEHRGDRAIRQEFDMGSNQLTVASLNARQIAAGLKLGSATGRKDAQGRDTFYVLRADGTTVLQNEPSDTKISQGTTNLEWTAKDLGVVDKATANVYLMKKERWSADDTANGYAGNVPGETTTTITTQGANVNFDWKAGQNTILKTGLNYRHQEIEPHFQLKATDIVEINRQKRPLGINLVHPEKTDIGAYLEAIGEIGQFTLTGGVRYDHFKMKTMDSKTVSDSAVNPSVALVWKPLDNLSFSANHNYATRSPRLYDALLAHGLRGVVSIKDGTTAERARNTEVGFNYKHDLANYGDIALKGSYFWQTINDAVVNPQNRHVTVGGSEITNGGFIKNKGFELDFTYKLKGLTAKFGVADADPVFYNIIQNNGNDLNPEFGAKVGRTWTGSLAYRFAQPNLEIGVKNRTAEKSERELRANIVLPAARQSYSVTDIFANWKPLSNDKLNVNFSVDNVTNKNYRPHSQRATSGTPAVGRDFRIGMNYTF